VELINVVTVIVPAMLSFVCGIAITPIVTHYLYKHRAWKKKAGKGTGYGGGETPLFDSLHQEKDTGTPRMGGIVIWASVIASMAGLWIAHLLFDSRMIAQLEFLSREQTWLPLVALLVGAGVGLIDDILVVRGAGSHFAGGLPLSYRLASVAGVASFAAYWFYAKLEVSSIAIPFAAPLELGVLFIPLFVLVAIAIYASGVIDGIDGLSGGVFGSIFAAYAIIAFAQNQNDLAAFCAAVVGGILAFLWFNIPPARFYMTETGIMALTMALTVVAFTADTLGDGIGVVVLPIIGALLVATVASDVIQVASKRLRNGAKVFKIAPLHHHFEAIGWPGYKVTMRYWIVSVMFAFAGVVIALVG
jgi:phospho-N-acetylmuramoyl-pentapeptide-transferase